jgi:PAS domain S-box-containing protein
MSEPRRHTWSNPQQLWEEMATLRDRLEDAEEALRAISSGEVDALVIRGGDEERVFTLAGADRPYRVMVEAMQEGAVTLSPAGDISYSNQRFADLVAVPHEQIVGRRFVDLVGVAHRERFKELFVAGLAGAAHGQVDLVRPDGAVPVGLALNPVPLEGTASVCIVVTDLSEERRRAEERRLLETIAIVGQTEDLDAALRTVLQTVGEIAGAAACEAWLPRGEALVQRATWTADPALRFFVSAAGPIQLARGEGLAGQSWGRAGPLFVDDVVRLPGFHRKEEAKAAGVRGALAVPVMAEREIVAVITVFLRDGALPGARSRSALQAAVAQLGAVIQRRRADERMAAQLREKEVLLKEIHHRVKNNLQVVTSLLRLQSRRLPDARLKEALLEAENRVMTMALIHESLYRSPDLARIPFDTYLRALLGHLVGTWVSPRGRVKAKVEAPAGLAFELDAAIPLGLIVHELVTNALKHAFPRGREGTVVVRLEADPLAPQRLVLVVRDDGVGMRDADAATKGRMGMELVRTLASQLEGELSFHEEHGLEVRLHFPGVRSARGGDEE